ncbi:hypothetical protein ACFYUK_08160 [Nonomuraea wenchangensis]
MVKGNLIAAGGVLAAAVAIIGVAGPANAGVHCDLGSIDKTHSFGIDAETERIWFTSRETKSCQSDDRHHHDGRDRSDDGSDRDSDDGFKGGFDGGFKDGFDGGFDDKSHRGFDGGFDGGFKDGFKGGSGDDSDDHGFDGGFKSGFDDDFKGDFKGASYGDDKHGRDGRDLGRGWGWIEPDDHGRTWGANGYRYQATTHNRHQ